MKFANCIATVFVAVASASPFHDSVQQYKRQSGRTIINIGQNYVNEWNGFAEQIRTPSGIRVYGNIYDGNLNRESAELLSSYAATHSGNVLVGMSWKDDMINHDYPQFESARLCVDIASGVFDTSLERLGRYLARFQTVRYQFRVDYEVSRNLHANTNPTQFDPTTWDLTAYPRAFAHVREQISRHVSNVQFMFHPVRGSAQQLYPGDNVVDLQGFSIFNNDVCLPVGSTANCNGERVDPNIRRDIEFATRPMWIAESAAQPPAANNPDSFIGYLMRVKDIVEQDDFAGWTYINSNWNNWGWPADTWGDSRIETNDPVRAWFMENIANYPRYVFE